MKAGGSATKFISLGKEKKRKTKKEQEKKRIEKLSVSAQHGEVMIE